MAKYKAYPEYKDSGVEWLGKIPCHWKTISISRLFSRTKRSGYTEKELLSVYRDYGVIPKSSRDDNNNKPSEDLSPYQLVQPNDLVMNKMKAWQGSIAISEYEGIVSPAYFVYQPNKILFELAHPKYVHYLLRNPIYVTQYLSRSKGIRVNQWDLDPDEFRNIELLLPDKIEQEKIYSFLDHETAKIDNLIEKQQQLIELLKEKCQAVISHAVTKGLNPDVPMKYSGVEWLGEVPAHWVIPKLLHVTKAIGDGLHSTPEYEISTGYYFINGNNLVDGKISIGSTAKEVSRDEYNKHYVYLDKKTVLLSINGTIGNVAIYNNEKVILGKSAAYVNCGSVLDVNYLMYYFLTNESRYYFDLEVTGTTILNLSLNSIRQMKVCIPPLEEQQFIIEYCVEKQRQYNYLIDSAEMAIKVMQERRTALISAAVTGKIDVRDWVAPDTQDVEEPQEATA
ncbi:TPA: restriction endonuclease subunit S [Klebsiella quasipneumoniae subsp. similipneumoniae]|nr:restriction endonuclease subunit S [Klebsiella quasipneumoniae subsp. similipneumoniae]HCI6455350.1 restriction endonuclease subunit S [Klebsiella quasipneumoniae subsp. similipneumoniae]HCI6465736.1 restriction endonuclease subunit S [Klebsiella quasipneumoniae subsp. similipneumoniae]HCI6633380.1 restriction endonuclease subunit S [Klebsiella quasipneumoniae subsp. similipneumoniae]